MTTPYPYQLRGVRRIERFHGRALLADEMGLGKTLQALLWWKQHPEFQRTIVVCPAALKYNWEHEASLHIHTRAHVLEGSKPKRRARSLLRNMPAPLIILNYDILKGWLDTLKDLQPDAVILDEAHYIKNRNTLRSKTIRKLCEGVPNIVALSGTPLTNRPSELWPVLNIIHPILYPSFFPYAQRYCSPKRTPWGWDFRGATRLNELHSNLKETLMIRRLKRNVLKDLPPKSRYVIPLEISNRKEYEEAVNNFLIWLSRLSTAKAKRAAKAERITQMGYLKRLAALLKLDAVINWIDSFLAESDEKLVIYGIHKAILAPIVKRYRPLSVFVDGSVPSKIRKNYVHQFQTNAKTRLFIGNIQAAGVGITLTAACTVTFIELPWTPGEVTQAEDRIHRIGQTQVASCYYLVARGTIEDHLCRILQSKQDVISAVLDGHHGETLEVFDLLERYITKGKLCPRTTKPNREQQLS